MELNKLGFGIASFPKGANKKDPISAIRIAKDLGLDCLELEFAHGLRMKDETALDICKTARESGITLTAHAPYYINLNAKEQDKIDASINRLLQTARLAGLCGAYSMTFHAAFYMKDNPQTVYDIVKKYLKQITDRLVDESNPIELRPELTGKKDQLNTLDELCDLSSEVPQVYPSMDFHFTQQEGKPDSTEANNYEYFVNLFTKYKARLGKKSLSGLHLHITCNEVGPKGETKHLSIRESKFNHVDFLKACNDMKVAGSVICDGPDQEADALYLKSLWTELKLKKSK